MKRIDLFMPPLSNYGVLHHFTKKLHEALLKQGVKCRLLEAKKNDPGPFLKSLLEDPPECTLSFNGLLPDDHGRFFCDMINIPHVACLVDSPNIFLPLTHSPLSIITCVDRASVDFFQGLGFANAIFMPHAIESTLAPDSKSKRNYEVVMLGSFTNYEAVRSSWKKKYPAPVCKAMDEAAEISLKEYMTPFYIAFVQALDRQISRHANIDPQKIDFASVLDDIEMYIRSKDRIELLKSIDQAKVDIFGSSDEEGGWKKYLGHKPNIKIHEPVPFDQALEIMKHSKIVLNSCPWIKNGAHERILAGLACGALVITNENIYLREQFQDGKSILFYQPTEWDKANHRINEYLADDTKREHVVQNGRNIVMKSHTWDQRAAQLIKDLPPLLKKIRQK